MRSIVVTAVVAVVLFATADTAQAAVEARLNGNWRVAGKIVASNFGTQGIAIRADLRFTPLCFTGPCRQYGVRRRGPRRHHESLLRRKRPGVYRGIERSGRIRCPNGRRGRQRVKIRIRIFAAERNQHGVLRATRIRGTLRARQRCRGRNFFERAKVFGRRRR